MRNGSGYSGRRSSTPDIALPLIKNRNWGSINTILFIDESLNDSGAAVFKNGKYQAQPNAANIDIGLSLTLPASMAQIDKLVRYDQWVTEMITAYTPDVVIGESHPFARGSMKTSTATLDVMAGIRYITMLLCGKFRIPYAEFSTNHVKTIMCGAPAATKEMVQMILTGCGYELPQYDGKEGRINGNVCDAIAMGEVISRMQRIEVLRLEYASSNDEGRPQTKKRISLPKPGNPTITKTKPSSSKPETIS